MRNRSGFGWFEIIVGILMIVLGIISFFNPSITLTWVVVLYGLMAVVMGISDIVFYVKTSQYTGFGPMLSLITGILSIMAGSMIMLHPSSGQWLLILLLPIWFIAHCISRLAHLQVVRSTAGTFFYYFLMVINIIGIVLGIIMIFKPYVSFLASGIIIGIYLIITGIDLISTGMSKLGSNW